MNEIMTQAVTIDKEFKSDIAKLPAFRDAVLARINKELEGKQLPLVVLTALENFKNARFDKVDGDKGDLLSWAKAVDWDVARVGLADVLRSYK